MPTVSSDGDEPHRASEGAVLHRSKSFWFDTSAPYVPNAPLRENVSVDCCILGGGITGMSSAYHLKSLDAGVSVAVLEGEVVGFGASGRNAGQFIVQFGGGNWRGHMRRYGAERMGQGWKYTHDGIRLVEQLQVSEGIDCDFAATGYMKATLRAEGSQALDGYLDFLQATGQAPYYTLLSQDEVEDDLGSPHLGPALLDSRGGQFNPLKLVRGLKQAAERRGAKIYENSPVVHVEIEKDHIILQTGMGSIRCKKLIVAANAYLGLINGINRAKLQDEQTSLLVKASVTEPLTEGQWDRAGWKRRCAVNIVSDLFYSFAPTIDGRMLSVGGYYTDYWADRSAMPEVQWRLREEHSDHLAAFFPRMESVKTAQTWGGPISITMDWMPHVGLSRDPRIAYACGCWGNGMALGTHNGLTLAQLTLEQRSENTDLWFVKRDKRRWPGRFATGVLAARVIANRRSSSRRIGGMLTPPIRFHDQ